MDPILFILIFIVLIITGIILSILISNYNNDTIKNYYSDLPFKSIIQDNAKNMNPCPIGCVRGVCSHKKKCTNPQQQNCCVYDFQCNYCKHVQLNTNPVKYYKKVIRSVGVSTEMKNYRKKQNSMPKSKLGLLKESLLTKK